MSRGVGRVGVPVDRDSSGKRTVIRWLAIHTNVKWPHGVRTVPEADQEIGGTRQTEVRDVDELGASDIMG